VDARNVLTDKHGRVRCPPPDFSHPQVVAQVTRLLSGWGLKYFDYDNDGAMDLILANGHPDDMIGEYPLFVKRKEPLLLFHRGADGKPQNLGTQAGAAVNRYVRIQEGKGIIQ
jgi:hypothetical protein